MTKPGLDLVWRARQALTPERRAAVRRLTDPWVGPAGSVKGVVDDTTVGLTFDDGPGPATDSVLDVLAHHEATATFFMLSDRAEARPEVVRRVVADGHEVALHGLDHTRLTLLDGREVRGHVLDGKRRLERCAGVPVRWFRPPFGSQSLRTFVAARRCGLQVAVWSCDADDWNGDDPHRIARLALERVRPGGILLLHDAFENDPIAPLPEPEFDRAASLDEILTGLTARGVRAVDLGRLVEGHRVVRTAWFRP